MKNKDFVKISVEEAFEILTENQDFRDYIDDHGMIFVDGCFVKADEKFIEKKYLAKDNNCFYDFYTVVSIYVTS